MVSKKIAAFKAVLAFRAISVSPEAELTAIDAMRSLDNAIQAGGSRQTIRLLILAWRCEIREVNSYQLI